MAADEGTAETDGEIEALVRKAIDGKDVLVTIVSHVRDLIGQSSEIAVRYVDRVREELEHRAVEIQQQRIRHTWRTFFARGTSVDSEVRLKLVELWLSVANRAFKGWIDNVAKHEETVAAAYLGGLHYMLDQAADFISAEHLGDPLDGNERKMVHRVRDMTDQVHRYEDDVTAMRQKTPFGSVGSSILFDHLMTEVSDEDLNKQEQALRSSCTSSWESLENCRAAMVTRLVAMRDRMEKVLQFTDPAVTEFKRTVHVPLHGVEDHLFDASSYVNMRPKIMAFLRAPLEAKSTRKLLLQKQFEHQALKELVIRFQEADQDLDALRESMAKKEIARGDYENMLGRLENLEWICRRTWQQRFPAGQISRMRQLFWSGENPLKADAADTLATSMTWVHNSLEKLTSAVHELTGSPPPDPGSSPPPGPVEGNLIQTEATLNNLSRLMREAVESGMHRLSEDARPVSSVNHFIATVREFISSCKSFERQHNNGGCTEVPPSILEAFRQASYDLETAKRGWMSGGGGAGGQWDGEVDDGEVDEPMAAGITVSVIQNSIFKAREGVRKYYNHIRGRALNVLALGVGRAGLPGTFVRECLEPRLRQLVKCMDAVVPRYLRSRYDPAFDTRLQNVERSDTNDRWRSTRVSFTDVVAWKFNDSPTLLLYLLKGIRLIVQVAALFAAQKVFTETYTRVRHVEGADPPHMHSMLFMFLSIDATFQMIVLVILVLISYTYKNPSNTLILDDALIQTFLVEYFISTSVLYVLGVLAARLLRSKRYFDYPNKGIIVGKAYRDIMTTVCTATFLIPFFILF
jgi:hypothetical protein